MTVTESKTLTPFAVNVVVAVSDQMVDALLTDALEGGSNYWAGFRLKKDAAYEAAKLVINNDQGDFIVNAVMNHGCTLEVWDKCAPNSGDRGEVTRESLLKGLNLMASRYPHHWKNVVEDDADATTADVLFQLAALGDLVFG